MRDDRRDLRQLTRTGRDSLRMWWMRLAGNVTSNGKYAAVGGHKRSLIVEQLCLAQAVKISYRRLSRWTTVW